MISRRSFFTKLAGTAVVAHVVPSLPAQAWGTGGAHIGALALERKILARDIAAARWKWAVIGDRGSSFLAFDPFDRRDLIVYQAGEWAREAHTADPNVRMRTLLDEDVALRILGVDPIEATKALIDA